MPGTVVVATCGEMTRRQLRGSLQHHATRAVGPLQHARLSSASSRHENYYSLTLPECLKATEEGHRVLPGTWKLNHETHEEVVRPLSPQGQN